MAENPHHHLILPSIYSKGRLFAADRCLFCRYRALNRSCKSWNVSIPFVEDWIIACVTLNMPLMPEAVGCHLPPNDRLFQHYHDKEWGRPVSSDRQFFEKVCLEGFQSGLSWQTVLHRRPAFREVFEEFELSSVARFTQNDVDRLMQDARIIRNRRKILSAINNARCALTLQNEAGSIAEFFWQFEPSPIDRPACVTRSWLKDNPHTAESTALSQALKKRGWSFIGPTNMYALMQALGIVNDHVSDCPCRKSVEQIRQVFIRPVCLSN